MEPKEHESIENYATRLLLQINSEKPILIGLSFGGMMAVEVSKQIETEKIILISSAKTKNEIPFYYRLAGKTQIHKLLPTVLLKKSNFLTNWLFGANSTTEKQLLKQILKDTDSKFLKWAIHKIVNWSNTTQNENIFHIHGTKDKILPLRFVKCNRKVIDGGHLMTLNKAEELNIIIKEHLR